MKFRMIEHAADLAFRLEGDSWLEVVASGTEAFNTLLAGGRIVPETARRSSDEQVEILAESMDEVIVQWINELLFLFESRRILVDPGSILEQGELVAQEGEGYLFRTVKGPVESSGLRTWRLPAEFVPGASIRKAEPRPGVATDQGRRLWVNVVFVLNR